MGLLACVGVGNALVDLGGFTLMARLAPDDVLARVFGLLESLVALAVGLGAIVGSLLIELVGVRLALVVVGLLCPILVAASLYRLRRLDRFIGVRDSEIRLLQTVPMLSPLPLPPSRIWRVACSRSRSSWYQLFRRRAISGSASTWSGPGPPRSSGTDAWSQPSAPETDSARSRCFGACRERPRCWRRVDSAPGASRRPLSPGRPRLHASACEQGDGPRDARPLHPARPIPSNHPDSEIRLIPAYRSKGPRRKRRPNTCDLLVEVRLSEHWCGRGESNPYALSGTGTRPARLPVTPLPPASTWYGRSDGEFATQLRHVARGAHRTSPSRSVRPRRRRRLNG